MMRNLIIISVLLLSSLHVHAQLMYEAYLKIEENGKHVGYAIQKYEYNKASKQFTSTYYIRTNLLEGGTQESLRAVCDNKFNPISYQYTAQVGKAVKTVDAKFTLNEKNLKATAVVGDGKNNKTISKSFKKGTFLSTFLNLVILQYGYKTNQKYDFSAIAEEKFDQSTGSALFKSTYEHKNKKIFVGNFVYSGSQFESHITEDGQAYKTVLAAQGLSTEVVKTPAEATKGFKLNQKTLKGAFKKIPRGTKNFLQ